MEHFGRLSRGLEGLEDSVWLRKALAGLGELWRALEGSGRLWRALEGSGGFWRALECFTGL